LSIETDIEQIFDFLDADEPFEGTSEELAHACGVPYRRLWDALHKIRSADFIAEQRWTIPNVSKGMGYKAWSIVENSEDEEALRDGFKIRAPEVFETIKRLQAQSSLAVAVLDGRTAEGRWWNFVNAMSTAVVSAGEIVVAEVAPEPAGITSE
jgi:hypothetical protein